MKVQSESEVAQSCPTLCNPMDCSLPGSSVHGIFQARVLEWVATAFSRIYDVFLKLPCFLYDLTNAGNLKSVPLSFINPVVPVKVLGSHTAEA